MSNQEILDFLKECGCCDICCLRHFKARGDDYEDVELSLQKLGLSLPNKQNSNAPKKLKQNYCTVCFGFFAPETLNKIIDQIASYPPLAEYENGCFVVALSFPVILQIRQLSLWLALIKKFGSAIDDTRPPEVPLKEAAKLVLNSKLAPIIGKTYDQNSGIMINVFLNHEDEGKDLETIKHLKIEFFSCTHGRQKGFQKEMTRGFFEKNFIPSNISSDTYEKHLPVPPDVPTSALNVTRVTVVGPTVFLAGRYRKYSRELSHSPWVLHGKRVMEDSIEELIAACVTPYFGVSPESVIFSSSGREDVDVRCLGEGRPFVLEIPDSKKTTLAQNVAAAMELATEKSQKISVQHLQLVDRKDLVHIKMGEEKKRKFYRALCTLKKPPNLETLNKLNMPNGFEIQQLTPIRVLHRRPLLARPRTVYSVKAYLDRDHPQAIVLDVVTQAGTYIKELVHGEFGRTQPSIASIIEEWIDIIALDVVAIDLDWPKHINNKINSS